MRTIKTLIAAAMLTIGLAAMAAQPVVYTLNLPQMPAATNGVSETFVITNFTMTTQGGTVVSNWFDTEFQTQFTLYGQLTLVSNGVYTTASGASVGLVTFNTIVSPDSVIWMTGSPFVMTCTSATAFTNVFSTISSNYASTQFRYWAITNVTVTVTNSDIRPNLRLFFKAL